MIDVKSKEDYPLENPSYLFAVIIMETNCWSFFLLLHSLLVHAHPCLPNCTLVNSNRRLPQCHLGDGGYELHNKLLC